MNQPFDLCQLDQSMKKLFLIYFIFCTFSLNAQQSTAYYDSLATIDSIAHVKHHHPLPLECSGIRVDSSDDAFVQKRFGTGLYYSGDGHGGVRYYTDSSRTVIFKSVIGVDTRIEEVALTLFVYPFNYTQDKLSSISVSNNLSGNPGLIGGIKFGDSVEKVIKVYGQPNLVEKKDSVRTIVYEDDYERWPEVLFYSARFEFENNKLRRITIYNGD